MFVVAGCDKVNEPEAYDPSIPEGMREYIEVSAPQVDTKAVLGKEEAGKVGVIWSEGDEIAVVDGVQRSVYRLCEGAGQASAKFKYVEGVANPDILCDVIYPASASLDFTVPEVQAYIAGSFDPAAVLFKYHNETGAGDDAIVLRAQTSFLQFQLTGKGKLDGIEVSIAGAKSYTLALPSIQLTNVAQSFYVVIPSCSDVTIDVNFILDSGKMTRQLLSKTFIAGKLHKFAVIDVKPDSVLKLMSYNIGMCSKSSLSTPAFTASIVKELNPDVAVLNEVKGSHSETIAKDWGYRYEESLKSSGYTMGNMLEWNKNKFAAPVIETVPLKNIKSDVTYNEDRVCIIAEFPDFVVLGTHLEKDDFLAHAEILTDKVAAKYKGTDKTVFLCGDMNTRPYALEMLEFQKDWQLISREDQPTLYNEELSNSLICIDYIFVWKGGMPCQVLNNMVATNVKCGNIKDASDHFPIMVEVKLGNSSLPLLKEVSNLEGYVIVGENW